MATEEVVVLTMIVNNNNLRLNGIISVVELQTFVCIAINLLLIAMVTLLTALLEWSFLCLCVSYLWLCRIQKKVCFIAI